MTGFTGANGQPAAPPYTSGPYLFGQGITFMQGAGGAGVQVVKDSQIFYVDKNKTGPAASGNGLSWQTAFLTLTEAVAAAGAYDIIYMGRGYYQEAAVIEIVSTQRGLKIFGPTSGGIPTSNGLSSATSTDDILIINADDVEIAGITFWCVTNAKNGIDIGEDYDGYNNWIHDCCFITGDAQGSLGEYGIKVNNTDDCVGTLIENNFFHYMSTAAIVAHATRCTIRNNTVYVGQNAIGFDLQSEGSARPTLTCTGNTLIGNGTGQTGVKIATTQPAAGHLLLANNIITSFDTLITTGKSEEGIVNNQTYASAATYKQVDSS